MSLHQNQFYHYLYILYNLPFYFFFKSKNAANPTPAINKIVLVSIPIDLLCGMFWLPVDIKPWFGCIYWLPDPPPLGNALIMLGAAFKIVSNQPVLFTVDAAGAAKAGS